MDCPSAVETPIIIPLPAEALGWCPPARLTSNLGATTEAPRYISTTMSSMARPGRRVVSVKSRVTKGGKYDEFRFGWGSWGEELPVDDDDDDDSILTVVLRASGTGTVSFAAAAMEGGANGVGYGFVVVVVAGMGSGAVEVAVEMGEKR